LFFVIKKEWLILLFFYLHKIKKFGYATVRGETMEYIIYIIAIFLVLNAIGTRLYRLVVRKVSLKFKIDYEALKRNLRHMNPREFEEFTGKLFSQLGYVTVVTQASRDGGKDIVLENRNGKIYIECKHYKGSVGREIANKLYGVMCADNAKGGIIITTGHFTSDCIEFCKRVGILLYDTSEILKLYKQAYERI
jgi:HJR/Mrr/RecB family endonuclease